MSDRVDHCPFLNRADSRCSNHFSLDRLESAFDHCFGTYGTCPIYQEILTERKDRQSGQLPATPCASAVNIAPAAVFATFSVRSEPMHAGPVHVRTG